MKVMGIRVDPQRVRYALVESDGAQFTLLNQHTESRLEFPADGAEPQEKVYWLYRELMRVYEQHRDIESVCIKTNEYTPTDNKRKRESAHLEGVILLFCRMNNISVAVKLYSSLETRSSDVQADAQQRVDRTDRYWDTKIADAIVAAWYVART